MLRGDAGELAEQQRADALAVQRVGDLEGDLGALGVEPDVGAVADDVLVGPAERDQPIALVMREINRPLREPIGIDLTETRK